MGALFSLPIISGFESCTSKEDLWGYKAICHAVHGRLLSYCGIELSVSVLRIWLDCNEICFQYLFRIFLECCRKLHDNGAENSFLLFFSDFVHQKMFR